jgi:hypothetical protein
MQRARRAAAVAVVAMTGGLMLAGCQSQPSVAAYVGDTRISVDQVNTIVDDFDANSRANQGGGLADAGYGDARQIVLADLVFTKAVGHLVDDQNLTRPAVNLDVIAQTVGQPVSSLYVNLVAETQADYKLLSGRSTTVQPTDADVREIYDRLPHGDVTYADAKPQIEKIDNLGDALGLRNDIEKIFSQYHVQMNPQYRGTVFTVYAEPLDNGRSIPWVVAPLGTGTDDSDFVTTS